MTAVSHGTPPETRMATEIAEQFRHVPIAEAAPRIARHIHTFWDPRMRSRLIEQAALAGPEGDPLVAAAADCLKNGDVRAS